MAKLLYQGHGSLRITTDEGRVIYVDPFAGEGYDLPADLILVTHQHGDHNQVGMIADRNAGCLVITEQEALAGGAHQTFDLGYATVEAVEAGNNPNHDLKSSVGYVITLGEGASVYLSGDTSRTDQMAELAERGLDYAFYCCDGIFNMGVEEACQCAALVGARHSTPYHMAPGQLFDAAKAEAFAVDGRLIIEPGEEIELVQG